MRRGKLESRLQVGVLLLELDDALLRKQVAAAARRLVTAQRRFRDQGALAKRRQLFAKVTNELRQLRQRMRIRK